MPLMTDEKIKRLNQFMKSYQPGTGETNSRLIEAYKSKDIEYFYQVWQCLARKNQKVDITSLVICGSEDLKRYVLVEFTLGYAHNGITIVNEPLEVMAPDNEPTAKYIFRALCNMYRYASQINQINQIIEGK